MQLCRYTAGIATNRLVTPYVIDNVTAVDGTVLYEGQTQSVPLDISEPNIEAVRYAMRCVVTGTSTWPGTAQDIFSNFPVDVVCKTGTAETGYEEIRKEYSNGLFVCYAPAEDPEIAIALVVERGEWGSSTAIIAQRLLSAYFDVAPTRAEQMLDLVPITGDDLDALIPAVVPDEPAEV